MYIPCMNRVSTNPKCAYSFFNSDANTIIWNTHTLKFRGIYLVYPRVMTIYVVSLGFTRYIPVI